jgi:hypothetical protein
MAFCKGKNWVRTRRTPAPMRIPSCPAVIRWSAEPHACRSQLPRSCPHGTISLNPHGSILPL